ncbi:MAG TPA: segregation/condensation protein A [Thermomicrobiaceae bacterium]|nr:segregation/condensation protein A [Thermomicrobiaceae bacterium]
MAVAAEPRARLEPYQLRLPVFEGPLDVLLRLIEQRQLAIADISLVSVTDQFVAYLASGNVPSASLADFAAMAGRLLVLKSRSLLPVPPLADGEAEPEDLAAQLAAYQAMKAAAARLQELEHAGLRAFTHHPPAVDHLQVAERLAVPSVTALSRALYRCLARVRPEPEPYIPTPSITLGAMTRRLMDRLRRRAPFSTLVGERPSRTEYSVAFIALLMLLRHRVVDASQTTLFGEIEVLRIGAPEGNADG